MQWGFKNWLSGTILLCAWTAIINATVIEVVVLDAPNFGFNDPSAVAEVGGNPGTTLGEQRINVLQRAGEIWAAYLQSDVPIKVEAQFEDWGSSPDGYALAGARAISVVRNFANAPVSDTWYPVALGNSLAGTDLTTGNDIGVTINIAPDIDAAIPAWYYGLDGNAPPGTIDLLDVLLHEIGHGLGFASFVNIVSGSFLDRIPDIYTLNLYDTSYGSGWGDLKKHELKLSAKNDPYLVWSGPYTQAAMGQILEGKRAITVDAPLDIAGEYAYEAALFGKSVPDDGISGLLVVVNDGSDPISDACESILNGTELSGNIAYIDRGTCNFDSKVLKAQLAGAIAVIIANNILDEGPMFMSGNDEVDGVLLTIPAISISMEDGLVLSSSSGVTMTIGTQSAELAGTNSGLLRLYAPDPLEQGSSVSHWSPDASPDLLMEPFINPNLREDLDLSLTLMKDIGWNVINIPYPYLTYALWVEESFSSSATLLAEGDDPDGDGILNIEEYFFGGDPESPSLDLLPKMVLIEPDLDFVYTRATFFTDLDWGYEVSTDMITWIDAIEEEDYTEELIEAIGDSAENVRLRLVRPDGGGKIFVRIRILIK